MTSVRHSIGVVSRLTGIAVETLRAWERRYGVVAPRRDGRARTYDDRDVERLRQLRDLVAQGHAIGRLARLGPRDLEALHATARAPAPAGGRAGGPGAERLWSAVEQLDAAIVELELYRMAALLPPEAMCLDVVVPLLRRVGDAWFAGQLGIAHEHLLSGAVRTLLGTLVRFQRATGGAVVLATPEGELHEFGLLSAALLAAGVGLSPLYLGSSVPARDIVTAARQARARAVVVAATVERSAPDPVAVVRAVAEELGPRVAVFVGGARTDRLAGALRAGPGLWLDDLAAIVDPLRRLAARRP